MEYVEHIFRINDFKHIQTLDRIFEHFNSHNDANPTKIYIGDYIMVRILHYFRRRCLESKNLL